MSMIISLNLGFLYDSQGIVSVLVIEKVRIRFTKMPDDCVWKGQNQN